LVDCPARGRAKLAIVTRTTASRGRRTSILL
jgi:hypothetical protein